MNLESIEVGIKCQFVQSNIILHTLYCTVLTADVLSSIFCWGALVVGQIPGTVQKIKAEGNGRQNRLDWSSTWSFSCQAQGPFSGSANESGVRMHFEAIRLERCRESTRLRTIFRLTNTVTLLLFSLH